MSATTQDEIGSHRLSRATDANDQRSSDAAHDGRFESLCTRRSAKQPASMCSSIPTTFRSAFRSISTTFRCWTHCASSERFLDTFWRPITQNTIFVAQNTRSKRAELDEQAVQTFYLSNAWQQNDLNDVQTALRNVMPNAKVYGVASQNAIVMRATPDELLLAQKLVNDLDKARPEVVVDIAILEVSKNWERNLGISWPSSASVALQPPTRQAAQRQLAPRAAPIALRRRPRIIRRSITWRI